MFLTKNKRSIRSIWHSQLRSALDVCLLAPDLPHLPITPSRDARKVAYRSAIAVQLAAANTTIGSPLNLAQHIVAQFPQTVDFTVSVSAPGWIDGQLTDVGWGKWLQHLTAHPINLPNNISTTLSLVNQFPLQYAHARCCNWLRLADREGLIVIQSSPTDLNIVAPNPLPWLEATESLRLQHPAERSLMCQLVAVVDALEEPTWTHCTKLAVKLSQAFEQFERQCRIFGEVKTENSALAIARLGLISATQTTIHALLNHVFHLLSPMEL